MPSISMNQRRAEIILVVIVAVGASAYLFMRIGMNTLGPFGIVAWRCTLGAFALALPLARRLRHANRATIRAGAILGVLMFAVLALQTFGLPYIMTSEAAFLSASAAIFVPIVHTILTRKLPTLPITAGCALALTGVALLTGARFAGIGTGVFLYLTAAIIYAVFTIVIARFDSEVDIMAATAIELLACAGAAWALTAALEGTYLPGAPREWAAVAALGLLCSGFALGLQPWAQQYSTPERWTILHTMAPLFAAALGVVILHEHFSATALAGAGVLMAGVVLVVLADRPATRAQSRNHNLLKYR